MGIHKVAVLAFQVEAAARAEQLRADLAAAKESEAGLGFGV